MSMTPTSTRRFVLAARPSTLTGPVDDGVLELELETPVPALSDGEVLVAVEWLSIDASTRGYMNDTRSYTSPAPLGEAMRGRGAGTVIDSRHNNYKVGDRVHGFLGWQDYAIANGDGLWHAPSDAPLSAALNLLGIAGQTAWVGMHDIGEPKPGETVVVTAAAGGVGYVAVQLAVAAGARVIGIAGSAEKCDWVKDLGAEASIDYKSENLDEALARVAPAGIDVVFDNVGGATLDALLPHLAPNARVVLCGAISRYQGSEGPAPLRNWFHLLPNRVRMQGFIYMDHQHRFEEIQTRLLELVNSGQLHSREHVVQGLENSAAALRMLFEGRNFGKLLVHLPTTKSVDDPTGCIAKFGPGPK